MVKTMGWWAAGAALVLGLLIALGSAGRVHRAEKRAAAFERRVETLKHEPAPEKPLNAMPVFPEYPKHMIDDEVDLWHKRLSARTSNEPRRTR